MLRKLVFKDNIPCKRSKRLRISDVTPGMRVTCGIPRDSYDKGCGNVKHHRRLGPVCTFMPGMTGTVHSTNVPYVTYAYRLNKPCSATFCVVEWLCPRCNRLQKCALDYFNIYLLS